jgi:hypothetical protein
VVNSQGQPATVVSPARAAVDGDLTELDLRRIDRETRSERPLRCVSSGYLGNGCSCQATVPTSVATRAWARELDRTGLLEDRFFEFTFKGHTWLGYGRANGVVRGVYCPTHRDERDLRAQHDARRPQAARQPLAATG